MNLLKQEVVAIVGPQTSVVSHFVSHMGTATQVPLVSFSATDPSLSEDQYPYFVRMTHSDNVQMAAIAGIIQYYGWREVTALYTDDDFGNNGIDALGDALKAIGSSIVFKAGLDPKITSDGIGRVLTKLSQMESRVLVVHMEPNIGKELFVMAQWLQMMTQGYVWIVTEAMTSIMDYLDKDSDFRQALQGVVGTRSYIPSSPQLQDYKDRWLEYHSKDRSLGPAQMNNVYAWYAYDAVWMIAHAIKNFMQKGGATTFVQPPVYPVDAGGQSELADLKVFQDGRLFMNTILEYQQVSGITGPLHVDERGDLIGSSFEIVNMGDNGLRMVGFWSNSTGCLAFAPDRTVRATRGVNHVLGHSSNSGIQTVIWPGGVTEVPRGWVVPKNGRPLLIGVPNKIGYKEFVSSAVDSANRTSFHGFCIDVFQQALAYLPYSISYSFMKYGNGSSTPSYDALVNKVVEKDFDAVVGDVTITTKRSTTVDFTQPYTTSGLAVVVPIRQGEGNHAWAFMRPFTPLMWVTTGTFFFFTGLVLWFLEHKKNRDFRGRPKKQIVTTLWFIFSTLFFSQRERVNSTLGRAVLIIWLFVVLIIISSYTASLTSLLTVQQLLPTIQGISSLLTSNVPIGYQTGSFVRDYLLQLNVAEERLVPLDTLAAYSAALTKGPNRGGVGAIVDELPYVQLFLSSECAFTIAGQEFTKSGWGFAFPKGSQLAIDFSTAILKLAENGELQRIHDLWLVSESCTKRNLAHDSTELGLNTFWGLFLITGCASVFCCLVYWTRMIIRHRKAIRERGARDGQVKMSRLQASKSFLKSLLTFIEEEEVSTTGRRSMRRKKTREWDESSPNQGSSSSIAPTLSSQRISKALESITAYATEEFCTPQVTNQACECVPTPSTTTITSVTTSEAGTNTRPAQADTSIMTEGASTDEERPGSAGPTSTPDLEIQDFKFNGISRTSYLGLQSPSS
ncbi:glutamate receptor 3.6 isoform X2 [Physcomitrium patens]|nr:glutamate receptor 3.6-like isoform X2 [Physcomitrium patens]|eukprot:XP_024395915.1 glutamate receptor 3.6-like isoform X2 [Physcomitrella patens]